MILDLAVDSLALLEVHHIQLQLLVYNRQSVAGVAVLVLETVLLAVLALA